MLLRRLIAWSINQAHLVLFGAGMLIAVAGYLLTRLPVDVFPELNAPTVVVLTEAGGLTAEEVEQQVSTRIESVMTGLPGVRRVRSASAMSLSLIWVEFEWGDDIYRARQLVSEKLDAVRDTLPEGSHAELGPVSSLAGEIIGLSISSPDGSVSDLELRALAEFKLRPALMAVPGVAQVSPIGGELPEYQVHASQEQLLLHNLTLGDVLTATAEAHDTSSAGYLENVSGEEHSLRQDARVRSKADVESTVVRHSEGTPLTLGRVTRVGLGGAPRRGTGSHNGHSAVVLTIKKSPGTNTLAVTAAIDEALDPLEAALPAGVVLDRNAFRQSFFIKTSVDNLSTVVRDAVIIVVIILILFLLNVRATLITLTAIPLSLAASVIAMWALDMSINVMTLGGLAVAIGALVDDAIIDVENVVRRLRENEARPEDERKPFLTVIFLASDEIRSAVVFATVIICVVFVPLLAMQGLEGRFFRPLAFSYIVAVLASLGVALTVTPALCKLLLRRVGKLGQDGGFLSRGLQAVYRPAVRLALKLRWLVLLAAAVMTAAALWLSTTFGTSFLPEFNEGSFTVFVTAPPGTSLVESDRLARGIERNLAALDGIRSVTRRTGRAERDEHAEPVWASELDVTLKPGQSKGEALERVSAVLSAASGVTTTVGQPIEHRLSHILSGTPAAIAVNLYGEDLPTLRAAAKDVETALNSVQGTRDVAANREVRVRALPIRYNREALARYDLTPAGAAAQVSAAFSGAVVGQIREGLTVYDLVVRLAPEERRTRADVRNFILRGRSGAMVRLKDVARVDPDETPYLIARQNGRRKAVISANVAAGNNLGHVIQRVRAAVDPIAKRHGISAEYGGQFEAQQSASRSLALTGGAVLLLVLMLLNASLGSFRAALLVAVNLPLSIIGGIAAVFLAESESPLLNLQHLLTGGEYAAPVLSIASLVGFVTLFGIAVRNGMLLVNHYAWLQENEGMTVRDAIVRGSVERLIPILMTALTAVLGLIPLAMAAGQPGSELLAPLAVVVLGGLASSTFLNLFVVPAGYLIVFGGGFERKQTERLVLDGRANLEPGVG